jgi:hypothetical protein
MVITAKKFDKISFGLKKSLRILCTGDWNLKVQVQNLRFPLLPKWNFTA